MATRSTKPLLLASGLLIAPVLAWWAFGMTATTRHQWRRDPGMPGKPRYPSRW